MEAKKIRIVEGSMPFGLDRFVVIEFVSTQSEITIQGRELKQRLERGEYEVVC